MLRQTILKYSLHNLILALHWMLDVLYTNSQYFWLLFSKCSWINEVPSYIESESNGHRSKISVTKCLFRSQKITFFNQPVSPLSWACGRHGSVNCLLQYAVFVLFCFVFLFFFFNFNTAKQLWCISGIGQHLLAHRTNSASTSNLQGNSGRKICDKIPKEAFGTTYFQWDWQVITRYYYLTATKSH